MYDERKGQSGLLVGLKRKCFHILEVQLKHSVALKGTPNLAAARNGKSGCGTNHNCNDEACDVEAIV
jgi:hypothetical protein